MDDTNTMRTELAALNAKADKCWALACNPGATKGESDAAFARFNELTLKAAKVAHALYRATRKVA